MRAVDAALHRIDFGLEALDFSVAGLEVLVQTITLRNEFLLPLPESLLLNLDLLGKAFAESLLFFLELGVIQLSWASLAELSCLHLLCAVCFVVVLFGSVDEVEHMSSDEDSAELLEVAMLLILNFSDTPCVLPTLNGTAVISLDVFLRANNGERHSVDETLSVLQGGYVILLKWRLVNLDTLCFNDCTNLKMINR